MDNQLHKLLFAVERLVSLTAVFSVTLKQPRGRLWNAMLNLISILRLSHVI